MMNDVIDMSAKFGNIQKAINNINSPNAIPNNNSPTRSIHLAQHYENMHQIGFDQEKMTSFLYLLKW